MFSPLFPKQRLQQFLSDYDVFLSAVLLGRNCGFIHFLLFHKNQLRGARSSKDIANDALSRLHNILRHNAIAFSYVIGC